MDGIFKVFLSNQKLTKETTDQNVSNTVFSVFVWGPCSMYILYGLYCFPVKMGPKEPTRTIVYFFSPIFPVVFL